MVLSRRLPAREGVFYVLGQIVGGIAGAGAAIAEVVLTALLVLVVVAVSSTDTTAIVAGIPIG
jgi:glycerol uptake facilitator-like aquaporin